MNLIDVVQGQSWAIIPENLDTIHNILWNHVQGNKVDLNELEAQMGKRLENSYDVTIMDNGLAIIPLAGILAKKMNLFTAISGGTSTELFARDFSLAMEDRDIKAVVIKAYSPGGTVAGTEAAADLVYWSRGIKPIVTFADSLMASACYWVGSAADRIITEETGDVGSIGVVQAHYDYSKADEKEGVKRSFIYAGKYKVMGNDAEPLTREAQDYMQEGVDYLYSIFVNTVARNLGVPVDTVLEDMADARMFIGRQALDAGLVHEMGNFEMAMETALDMADQGAKHITTTGAAAPKKREDNTMFKQKAKEGDTPLTLEILQADYPDLVGQIEKQGAEGVDIETPANEAATSERERVLGLANIQFGVDAGEKFKAVVDSGVTVEQFQAVSDAGPEGAVPDAGKIAEMLEAIHDAGADNPGQGVTVGGPTDFVEAWKAIQKETGCTVQDAIKKAVEAYPDLHKAYLEKQKPEGNA